MLDIFGILNTEKSRTSFIEGLIYVSKAEEIAVGGNTVEPEELSALYGAMDTLKIPLSERRRLEELIFSNKIEINIEFDNLIQSQFLIREALQICYIEGCYGKAEKEMICKLGEKLGIKNKKIERLEEWVLEGINWSNYGEKLVFEEE